MGLHQKTSILHNIHIGYLKLVAQFSVAHISTTRPRNLMITRFLLCQLGCASEKGGTLDG